MCRFSKIRGIAIDYKGLGPITRRTRIFHHEQSDEKDCAACDITAGADVGVGRLAARGILEQRSLSMRSETRDSSRSATTPALHTWVLISILLLSSYLFGWLDIGSLPAPQGRLLLYCLIIGYEWGLFAFVFYGADDIVKDYARGLLRSRSKIVWDILIAIGAWATFACLAPLIVRALGYSGWGSAGALLPVGAVEIAMWIPVCMSAGICEEFVFRGYLQSQFSRWTGPLLGLLAQAVLFGVSHGYQGWKNMALIAVLGCVYGVVVRWRNQLRSNVIAHTFTDIAGAFGV
jgi:uncharacterized protein